MPIITRPATASDVPAVLPMVGRICSLHESWDPARYGLLPEPERRYERWLIDRAGDPRSVFLVIEREPAEQGRAAALAGFLVGTIESEVPIYLLTEYAFIHDLWVEPEYRHEGLARQLVMLAVERFGEIGVRQIRLATAAGNEAARALFASCGFRVSTMEMLVELSPEG